MYFKGVSLLLFILCLLHWRTDLILLPAGVRGVINTCEEFAGPQRTYAKHNITQIRLPCVDYCSPTLDQVETAMKFIAEHVNRGETVYSKSPLYIYAYIGSQAKESDSRTSTVLEI